MDIRVGMLVLLTCAGKGGLHVSAVTRYSKTVYKIINTRFIFIGKIMHNSTRQNIDSFYVLISYTVINYNITHNTCFATNSYIYCLFELMCDMHNVTAIIFSNCLCYTKGGNSCCLNIKSVDLLQET